METIKRNRTTIGIYKALFTLLETSNFDSISVNDICQEALISRTTFYSYFEDKYQLVLFSFQEERKMLGVVKGVDIENNLIASLEHMRTHETVYRNLWTSGVNRDLDQMITIHFSQSVYTFFKNKNSYSDQELEIITNVYTGGIVYTLSQWLEKSSDIPIDLISKTIMNLIKID